MRIIVVVHAHDCFVSCASPRAKIRKIFISCLSFNNFYVFRGKKKGASPKASP